MSSFDYRSPYSRSGLKLLERAREGIITMNVSVKPLLSKMRQPTGSNVKTLGTAGDGLTDVVTNEMVFIEKHDAGVRLPGPLGKALPAVFSSFNGIPIPRDISQRKFEAKFRFLGFARSDYREGDPTQPENGIAIQVHGTLTVPNNGTHSISTGQLLKWRLRKVDNEHRAADDAQLSNAAKHSKAIDPRKYTGIIEPVMSVNADLIREATDWLEKHLAEGAGRRGNIVTPGSAPIPSAMFDTMENFAMAMWQDGILKMILGLSALGNDAINEIFTPAPGGGGGVTFQADWVASISRRLGLSQGLNAAQFNPEETLNVLRAQLKPERGRLGNVVTSTPDAFLTMFESVLDEDREKVFGRALSSARPGDEMDIQVL